MSNEEFVQDVLITALLILDTAGERVTTHYYPDPNVSMKPIIPPDEQLKFEQSLTTTASRSQARGEMDIANVENFLAVFTQLGDIRVFVIIDADESESVAGSILASITQVLNYLFEFRINKETILNSIDLVLFLFDECVDNGYILEIDPDELTRRVAMRDEQDGENAKNFQQSDTSLANAIGMATSALFRGWQ